MLSVLVSTQWDLDSGLSLKIVLLPVTPSSPFVGWLDKRGSHIDVTLRPGTAITAKPQATRPQTARPARFGDCLKLFSER